MNKANINVSLCKEAALKSPPKSIKKITGCSDLYNLKIIN